MPSQPALCVVCAAHVAKQRGRQRGLLVAIGVVVPVLAVVAYLSTRPRTAPPVQAPAEATDPLEKFKRERFAEKPCEEAVAKDLVDYLMIERKWREAIAAGYYAIGRCGPLGDMRWWIAHSHKQIGQWLPAAVLGSELIAEAPDDYETWWWRGEAWVQGDLHLLALVDFRQSFASSSYDAQSVYPAVRFIAPATAANIPCEAARAWTYQIEEMNGKPTQEARDHLAAMQRAKTCVPENGTGHARVVEGKKVITSIGKVTGELMMDRTAGTTIVSRDYATRAGLTQISNHQASTLWSGVRIAGYPARLPGLTVGGASATNVEALISDELAVGDDGVIGLSFVWHFRIDRSAASVVLSPPAP